ncbi:hypothetical protein F0562_031065 [Nyssa sinensis]|uniref:Uncharacterized protein n=1 Tax=Nyssa sinensis TaxID=561372 RepID=A0A5J5AX27_9ASTE|nr:hypothetical protein F0562_031065 [Nyssa sinensis]
MEKAEQRWAALEEEEVVVVGGDLRGRRPRHRDTSGTATTTAVSNGNGDTRSPTQKQEFQEDELQNSNKDSYAAIIDNEKGTEIDGQERSEKNVYYDQDEGAEYTHGFSVVEHSSFRSSSETRSGDDGSRFHIHSELDAISAHATNDQGHDAVDICLDGHLTPAAGDYSHDREPDIFRCLSCFSFFIPTGNGFKLFQMFGDKSKKDNVQTPQQIPAANKSWFSSIFASDKGKMLIEQGSDRKADGEKNNVGTLIPSFNLNDQNGQPLSVREALSPIQSSGVGGLVKSSTTEPQEGGC